MPRQRKLKKMIRARMKDTGENYTNARMHILAQLDVPQGKAPDQMYRVKVDIPVNIDEPSAKDEVKP